MRAPVHVSARVCVYVQNSCLHPASQPSTQPPNRRVHNFTQHSSLHTRPTTQQCQKRLAPSPSYLHTHTQTHTHAKAHTGVPLNGTHPILPRYLAILEPHTDTQEFLTGTPQPARRPNLAGDPGACDAVNPNPSVRCALLTWAGPL
eukprot:scaffold211377_cov19-Tisochrysis_lutea.AAC.2